jgi:hypothetical protein
MSTETTTTTETKAHESNGHSNAAAPKKAQRKAAKKAGGVKAEKKSAPEKPKKVKGEYTGPGKVQIRILKALSKSGKALTGKQLAEKAEVDASMIGNQAGYRDEKINARPVHKHNLVNEGLVKIKPEEVGSNGATQFLYEITAKGRNVLEKVSA